MKEAIEQYRADKYEVHRLKEEKIVQDIEMVSLRTAYSRLQRHIGAQTHALESTEQRITEVYNCIDFLNKGMTDLKNK